MKIAEALVQIKDLKGKVGELGRNFQMDALFEQVEELQEVPSSEEKIEEYLRLSQELGKLKARVAVTNAKHGLTYKITEMEQLRGTIAQLEVLARHKQETVRLSRAMYGEQQSKIRVVATFNVEALAEKLTAARKRLRELDLELQKTNWQVDLVE